MSKNQEFTLRFCVGDPNGLQSGEWRIWADPGKSDIYIAIRPIGGTNKISLHASGACNVALTKQFAESHPEHVNGLGGTRHFDQWFRRTNTGDLLSIPLLIRFPSSELRPSLGSTQKKKEMIWLPPPPPNQTLDVICNFTSQPLSAGQWPWCTDGGLLLGSTDLPNGETFWAVSRLHPTPPNLQTHIEQQRRRASLSINTRLLIGETGPRNVRIITDAASSLQLPPS